MRDRREIGALATGLGILLTLFAVAPAAAAQLPDVVQVPEPGSFVLLATGAAALAGFRWLRRRK